MLREDEARARLRVRGRVIHRVRQAPRPVDQGEGAVPHADELPQAARFEAGGHEEEVRPRVDAVGQRLVVADHDRKAGAAASPRLHGLLVPLRAGTQEDDLEVPRQEVGHGLQEEVHPLLRHETAHESCQGSLPPQAQLPLQGALVGRLPPFVKGVEGLREMGVPPGVPRLDVQAVHHAPEVRRTPPDHGLQPLAVLRRLDLPCVGGAHGAQQVGLGEARLHEVQPALVKQDLLRGPRLRQAQERQELPREGALPIQIVDRVQGPGLRQERVLPVEGPQVGGNEGREPVVAVDDIGGEVHVATGLQDGAAEEAVAPPLVLPAVHVRPAEVLRMVHHEHGNLRRQVPLLQGGHLHAAPHGHVVGPQVHPPGVHSSVTRHDEVHLMAQGAQGLGQGAAYVPQAPHLREGVRLGHDKQDAHGRSRCQPGGPLNPAGLLRRPPRRRRPRR